MATSPESPMFMVDALVRVMLSASRPELSTFTCERLLTVRVSILDCLRVSHSEPLSSVTLNRPL
ncbi:hypothetical protein D3C76_1353710 [compost metagenome]